eukprot:ANDGO_00675.mRNA.1 putative phosphoinositide phosphatase SAC9
MSLRTLPRSTQHLFLRTEEGPCFLVSSLSTRPDVQVFAIDEFTGEVTYSAIPNHDLFASVQDAIRFLSKHFHVSERVSGCGLIGAIHTPLYLHIAMITRREKVAEFPFLGAFSEIPSSMSGHGASPVEIYMVEKAIWISIRKRCPLVPCPDPSMVKDDPATLKIAAKADKLVVDFSFDDYHFYCEGLDLTKPFPTLDAPHTDPDLSFLWNEHLAKPWSFLECRPHCVFLLQGVVSARILHEGALFKYEDKEVVANWVCVMIARHQSTHPGTRFRARGLNHEGGAGNEWEVDVVSHYVPVAKDGSGKPTVASTMEFPDGANRLFRWSSYTWRRGTVPIHWHQDTKGTSTEIFIDTSSPFRYSRSYFDSLAYRLAPGPYAGQKVDAEAENSTADRPSLHLDQIGDGRNDVFCVSLLRTEAGKKEKLLSDTYGECIDQLSRHFARKDLDSYSKFRTPELSLVTFDWHSKIKAIGFELTVTEFWEKISPWFSRMNVTTGSFSSDSSGGASIVTKQRSLFRLNCADSLDRTNLGTLWIFLQILPLLAQGVLAVPLLINDPKLFQKVHEDHMPFSKFSLALVRQTVKPRILEEVISMFLDLGDRISFLYTQSVAMHSAEIRGYFSSNLPPATSNLKILLTRRFHNVFSDEEKHLTYELVLGKRLPLPEMHRAFHGLTRSFSGSSSSSQVIGQRVPPRSAGKGTDLSRKTTQVLNDISFFQWKHATRVWNGASFMENLPLSMDVKLDDKERMQPEEASLLSGGHHVMVVETTNDEQKARRVPRFETPLGSAWICPPSSKSVVMKIMLTEPIYISAIMVMIRWPFPPSALDLYVCADLEHKYLLAQDLKLPIVHQDGTEITFVFGSSLPTLSGAGVSSASVSNGNVTTSEGAEDIEEGMQTLVEQADKQAAASAAASASAAQATTGPTRSQSVPQSLSAASRDPVNLFDELAAGEDEVEESDEVLLKEAENEPSQRITFYPFHYPTEANEVGSADEVCAKMVELHFHAPNLPEGAGMTLGNVHVFGEWGLHPILLAPQDTNYLLASSLAGASEFSKEVQNPQPREKKSLLGEGMFKIQQFGKTLFSKRPNNGAVAPIVTSMPQELSPSTSSKESGTFAFPQMKPAVTGPDAYRQEVSKLLVTTDGSSASSMFTFVNALRLEVFRMRNLVSPADRDRVLSALGVSLVAADPHSYIRLRNPIVEQIIRRRILKRDSVSPDLPYFQWMQNVLVMSGLPPDAVFSSNSVPISGSVKFSSFEMMAARKGSVSANQCAVCHTNFGISSWFLASRKQFCCHACRRVVCSKCLNMQPKAIPEYGWMAAVHRLCLQCSEIADVQQILIEDLWKACADLPRTYVWPAELRDILQRDFVCMTNTSRRLLPSSDDSFAADPASPDGADPADLVVYSQQRARKSPGSDSFFCEYPLLRLMNPVRGFEVGRDRLKAEEIFISTSSIPPQSSFKMESSSEATFHISLPLRMEMLGLLYCEHLQGRKHDDLLNVQVFCGDRLTDMRQVGDFCVNEVAQGSTDAAAAIAVGIDRFLAIPAIDLLRIDPPESDPALSIAPGQRVLIRLPGAVECRFVMLKISSPSGTPLHSGRIFPWLRYNFFTSSALPFPVASQVGYPPFSSDVFCSCGGIRRQRYHRSFQRLLQHGRVLELGLDTHLLDEAVSHPSLPEMEVSSRMGTSKNGGPVQQDAVTVDGVYLEVEHSHGIWKTQVRRLRVQVEKFFPVSASQPDVTKAMKNFARRTAASNPAFNEPRDVVDSAVAGGDPVLSRLIRKVVDICEIEIPLSAPKSILWFDFPAPVADVRMVRFEALSNYGATEVSLGKLRAFRRI